MSWNQAVLGSAVLVFPFYFGHPIHEVTLRIHLKHLPMTICWERLPFRKGSAVACAEPVTRWRKVVPHSFACLVTH